MGEEAERPGIAVQGAMRTIEYAVRADGSMPAKVFIESLIIAEQSMLAALFKRMADCGTVPNREQFKQVRDKVFEFKKHQIRVFCFRVGNTWVLTNGYKKKKDRLDPAEISRAEMIMSEHLRRSRSSRGAS